jgi:opacity protein-like surface antigen
LGVGTKLTFHETPQYKLGGIAQMTYASGLDIEKHVPVTYGSDVIYHDVKGELDFMEIQIAAGPTYMLNESVSVYGGPFLHFISGNFKHKDYFPGTGPLSDETDDVRESSWFGGYIGMQLNLIKEMPISVEWQHTAFADAVGANIIIRF